MKKWISAACALTAALLTAGCGASFEPSANSLYIQKDGTITEGIVESFEKAHYSVAEFESMLNREIDTYNKTYGEEKITVEQLEVKEDTLYLKLEYADDEAYAGYNEVFCLTGTVEEALDQGLSFNMDFKDKESEEYTTAEVTAKKKDSVVVLKEEGMVQLEKPVKYVSNNVEILSDHLLQVMPIEDSTEYAYIIY